MKKLSLLFILFSFMFSFSALAQKGEVCDPLTGPYEKGEYCWSALEIAVIAELNLRRAQHSPPLPAMTRNIFISKVSDGHTDYMIQQGVASHDGFSARAATISATIGATTSAEIVAKGYSSAVNVVNAWMASPSHYGAIMGDGNRIGIGVKSDATGTKYYTVIMSRVP